MHRTTRWMLAATLAALAVVPAGAERPPLATAVVEVVGGARTASFDGVVEAVRQTAVAAQVSGPVVELAVKAGDRVRAGQVLARIDARAAEQSAAASEAEVGAARASLEVATREFERQKQLYESRFTSRAALDRAEAEFKATQARVSAQLAQAGAARTQSEFYVVRSPYAGVVADVPVVLGDMAMPGRVLATLYDPVALRVTAAVPQSALAGLPPLAQTKVEIPGLPGDRSSIAPTAVELLPTVDPGTHTLVVRLALPAGVEGVSPGMFARAWLPASANGSARLAVPPSAIVRRAEMTGVYVVGPDGRPVLRQVRLGRALGEGIEVLSGVSAGEAVALEPQAAARVR